MQRVEQECNLKSTGVELNEDSVDMIEVSKMGILEQKIAEALERFKAMPRELVPTDDELLEFSTLCRDYKGIFQETFVSKEPAKLQPLRVKVRPGAKPRSLKTRSYSQAHTDFMRKVLQQMERQGLIYKNDSATFISPVMIVDKPGAPPGVFRLVVDLKYINFCTEATNQTLPMLKDELRKTAGMNYFMTVDFLQGFFQCPLDDESRDLYSMQTPFGVYTFTRTPQGAASCPGHFHTQLANVFAPIMSTNNAILWIDDLLVMAKTFKEFLQAMRTMFELCQERMLVLSVKKCELGGSKVKWCGRVVSREGVKMEARSVAAFMEMSTPKTAGDLSTFYHALTWMSEALVRWSEISAPLKKLLDAIIESVNSTDKKTGKITTLRKYEKVRLANAGWSVVHQQAFDQCKEALTNAVIQGHYHPSCVLCLFTDASDTHWAGLLTQVRDWQDDKPIEQQCHEPLGTLSGAFTHTQRNWSVIEKESYPIMIIFCKLQMVFAFIVIIRIL
jgi:hypothetical protein